LVVEKAKWYRNADSPVMFMIDDFANAWHNASGGDSWDLGGDWGGGLDREGSIFSFLEEHLLRDFPELRITFFTVAGRISHYTHNHPFVFAEPLNFSEESKRFFKMVGDDERFEIAYHGLSHGIPGEQTTDFVQEWRSFQSVEEAYSCIRQGLEIFKDAIGRYPSGGKYGGWDYNEFADESIDRSSFLWWCRDWMPRDTRGRILDSYYEPQFFGKNLVIAIPSTLHGFLWSKKQADTLLSKKQIISIEEHIAGVRPDGVTQAPNIVDDLDSLRRLLRYLGKKNVWYATGTEVAEYFTGYSQSTIYDIKEKSFMIKYSGKVKMPLLTLRIDCSAICDREKPYISLADPTGALVSPQNIRCDTKTFVHLVDIPLIQGEYSVQEVASLVSK
jgi:hypothetical protein